MSDLPQMPKRSLELPFGCKDLIDVDAIRNWKPAVDRRWPSRATSDRLAYIEGQVAELIDLGGSSKIVSIGRHQDRGSVMVISDLDLSASAVLAIYHNSTDQEAIREIFKERKIPPVSGPLGRWKSKNAVRYILPANASEAARLIGQVFCAGYGLGMMAMIDLSYHEPERA